MASYSGNPHTNDASLRSVATSFANAKSGSGTLSVISAASTTTGPQVDAASDFTNYYIDRYVMPYDTSSLGSGAIASAGTLEIYINLIDALPASGTCYLDLVAVNLASAPTIATGDWSNVVIGTACATRLSMASGAPGAKQFVLNASGLAAVSVTGYTTFAVVMGNDFSNSVSSPSNLSANSYTYMNCNTSNAGSNKPTLNLTYTPGVLPGTVRPRRRPLGLYPR